MQKYTPELSAAVTKAWENWLAASAPAWSTPVRRSGGRTAVADNGSSPAPSDQNGYSIVQADDLESAKTLLKDHRFLTEGKGRFAVEVFEIVPM